MHSRTASRWGILGVVPAGLFTAMLCAGSPALAQQPAPQPPAPPQIAPPQTVAPQTAMSPGTQLLLQRLQTGLTLERYLDNLRNDFFQIDADSDGKITQRDAELHSLMEGIQVRTAGLMTVMRYDLDGDGAVTEDEIRRAMRYDLRSQLSSSALNAAGLAIPPINGSEKMIEDNIRSIMALDTDKDGKVNYAEALKFKFPGLQPMFGMNGQSARARQALTLDSGSNGEVTLADYQAAGEALFRKIDADADGKISPQELADYRGKPLPPDSAARKEAFDARLREQAEAARKKREAEVAAQAGCDMPAASDKAKVVLLSAYETDALSSAALGSQDVVIHAGRAVVEPGDEPIYVVLASYAPTIWQFSGAVERIERLVMGGSLGGSLGGANSRDPKQPPLAGVAGIARERITFLARPNCLNYFSEAPSASSLQAAGTIRTKAGKAPDVVAAKYSVGSFGVPSGKIETLREQRKQPLVIMKSQGSLNIIGDASNVIVQSGPSRAREEMERFFPGGVTQIDPKSVVADVPVAAYEVLPAQAGLVQLLTAGAVTQNDSGEYIVRQKIRFPAGLSGAHAVTFLIMKGTPYPDGDPAHSCVIVEDTGESKGPNCRTR
jgi:Ca2+-binding EF-hand superfamily protein